MFAMRTPDDEDQRLQCDEADPDLIAKVRARRSERDRAIEVDIDALDTETPVRNAHEFAANPDVDAEFAKVVRFGVLSGKVVVSNDFDAPLPEDVLTGFEEITPENCHGLLLEGDAEGDEVW